MIEISQFDDDLRTVAMKIGLDTTKIVLAAKADLTRKYKNTIVLLATTDAELIISDGNNTSRYDLSEVREASLEEKNGTCAVMCRFGPPPPPQEEEKSPTKGEDAPKEGEQPQADGEKSPPPPKPKLVQIAVMTNTCRNEARLFTRYLMKQAEKAAKGESAAEGDIEIDEKDFRKEDFCPKCGKRYPDPNRKVCPKCMDRVSLVKRFMQMSRKFAKGMVLAILTLVITSALGIVAPYISNKFFYDEVLDITGRFYGQLLFVLSLMITTDIATRLINMFCSTIMIKVTSQIIYELKRTIFDSIKRLSMRFFTGRQTGGLMTQIENDANSIYWFFVDCFPYFFTSIIQVVTVFVLMLTMSVPLALASLIPLPIYIVVMLRVYKQSQWMYARNYTRQRAMRSVLSDALSGARVVKAFAREREETVRFNTHSQAAANMYRDVTFFNNTRYPILNIIIYFSTLIVWALGGWMVMQGVISYGTLMLFISYVGILNGPMFDFIGMSEFLAECINGLQRLFEISDAEPDVKEADNPKRLGECKGEVEFRDVCFSYEKGRETIHGIDFHVPSGNTLGIVGHSGAGKSTLANLLIRLYDTDSGGVFIDGINVRELALEELHRNVAVVSQETYLFVGTIAENISYACPEATREDIVRASMAGGAHEFIMKLPDAYETMIGFGYKDLSGGERQRISIARALLKNPTILILDEATAAMDTATERLIQNAVTMLSKDRTTIMIAHRLSTLRDADSLIVIENGKMPEAGTHVELLKKKGIYYKLYQLQLSALKNIGVEE